MAKPLTVPLSSLFVYDGNITTLCPRCGLRLYITNYLNEGAGVVCYTCGKQWRIVLEDIVWNSSDG